MNSLDVMAIAIIAISILGAVMKGLVVELFSLLSVVLGLVLASLYYDAIDTFFLGLAAPPTSSFLAFITIFLVVVLAGSISASLIDRAVRKLRLKSIDRLLGAFFGLVRGWLIVSILFLAFAAFSVQRQNIAESKTAGFFLESARTLVILLPDELKEKFAAGYRKALDLWIGQDK